MSYQQDKIHGIIVPDTSDILSGVESEWKSALGNSLNVDSNTPQGIMINAETIARSNVTKYAAEIANQINPALSTGTFLDAICGLMGIEREGNRKTVFNNVLFSGTQGVTVSAGSRVRTESGAVFSVVSSFTFPASGTIRGSLESVEFGSYPIGTIGKDMTIIDGVIGWGSVRPDIATTSVDGALRQEDISLRRYRKDRLGRQGRNSVKAIRANLLDQDQCPGVKSVAIRENPETTPGTIDGVVFERSNAYWVCVDGGSDQDIAKAMLDGKSGGSGWAVGVSNGTPKTVDVLNEDSGQTYPVKFVRPSEVEVHCRITVRQNNAISDLSQSVQDAILNWSEGKQPNESGLVVGADFTSFEAAGAVNVGIPGVTVKSCTVSRDGTTFGPDVHIELWEKAVLLRGSIEVTVE